MLLASTHWQFWDNASWGWSEAWALAALLAVSLIPMPGANVLGGLFFSLVNGKDGRWSTSKTSAVLWTYAVWFAFIATLIADHGKDLEKVMVKQEYLVLMGVPVAAAVVAKGLTQNKVDSGALVTKTPAPPETNPVRGVGQLAADDTGQADLLDFQYFGFNLILLAYFFTRFLGAEAGGLPSLPHTLVALSGVSAAGYIGKKGLQRDVGPAIRSVTPKPANAGKPITIKGVNFAAAGETDPTSASVLFGSTKVTPTTLTATVTDGTIVVDVPSDVTPGPLDVKVEDNRGVASPSYPIQVE